MTQDQLRIHDFKSYDEFLIWWTSPEVAGFRQKYPDKIAPIKAHRWVQPWLNRLEESEQVDREQPSGKTFGKYLIEKKLGQGGMGAVYLAHDPALNRKVALKIMLLKGPDATERFMREARASAKLKHPNIIQVHEIGIEGKYHYFTMEYIAGVSLDKLISQKDNHLTPQRIAEIISTIASALHYAHTQGIIHRDIKPANILIDKLGRPYLTDFGLAKEIGGTEKSLTLTGTIMGTADYMSPEQAQGEKEKINALSDIFSLGATLYHTLTGHTPFRGRELYQILESVVRKDPIPPSRLTRHLTRDMETICLKCLEKEQPRRYQSAQELADDLTRYLKGEPISARHIGFITWGFRKARQNKIISFSLAGFLLALIAISTAWRINNASTKKEMTTQRAKQQTMETRAKAMKMLEGADAHAVAILPEKKIASAEAALKIDPTLGYAYQVLGLAYMAQEKPDEAVKSLNRAVELDPGLHESYYWRAMIKSATPNADDKDLLSDYDKAIGLFPENANYFADRAKIHYKLKESDQAIDDLTRAIELDIKYTELVKADPNDLSKSLSIMKFRTKPFMMIYYGRALAFAQKGDWERAIKDGEKELEPYKTMPQNPKAIIISRSVEEWKQQLNK
ncbi:MAG: protein kinase [Planctomycetes bacterium]|nr:protein kinase [Planctomycetota bacterium]